MSIHRPVMLFKDGNEVMRWPILLAGTGSEKDRRPKEMAQDMFDQVTFASKLDKSVPDFDQIVVDLDGQRHTFTPQDLK